MIKLSKGGVYLVNGKPLLPAGSNDEDTNDTCLNNPGLNDTSGEQIKKITGKAVTKEEALKGTISYSILDAHNKASGGQTGLRLGFDCLASHDLTYVGVIQTARASGLCQFPLPYILTNCHNSLCAVGGTLNEDDHCFGLSAAKKYGGIYVPPHLAVIHSYVREMHAACGSMILGSDSHTRYGSMGTMGIGEGGGELVKQLLEKTYDIDYPEIVCVYLSGKVNPGVGPMDVALAIIGAVFKNGYVKNKIMEFTGEGLAGLSADFRHGIDIMTTETSCLSTIWQTDETINNYFRCHGKPEAFKLLKPEAVAWYDGLVDVNLSEIEPMIALPFHPSNVYSIRALNENAKDILRETEKEGEKLIPGVSLDLTGKVVKGKIKTDQGIIAGCAGGTWENIMDALSIIRKGELGSDTFSLSVYPASQPVMIGLMRNGAWMELARAGAVLRSSFCGPCFGAGDTPANGQLSIRHNTRNFPNREGSKPREGQIASVALMDSRSIAATAVNDGFITPAAETFPLSCNYIFDPGVYRARVYQGYKKALPSEEIKYGPNISDWPAIGALPENLLLGIASVINDPVTTTDELIPSGETSTYRSNPLAMARYTLSRKDPEYVKRALGFKEMEEKRLAGEELPIIRELAGKIKDFAGVEADMKNTGLGSLIYAVKPGDGSAREQAASCQRMLGGSANIAREYATRRYRSNLVNWGMLPLLMEEKQNFACGKFIFIPGIRAAVAAGQEELRAFYMDDEIRPLKLRLGAMTDEEKQIIMAGCLINYYKTDITPSDGVI